MHWTRRSELHLCRAASGALILPKVILWAFRLNEGDRLTVAQEPGEVFRCRLRSYGRWVRLIAAGLSEPRPFVAKLLARPMAAVGPRGTLRLPEKAAPLAGPGDVLLRVWPETGDGFTLEPAAGRRLFSPELFLEAVYELPVEDGRLLRLPEEVLWVLALAEGDLLAYRTLLGTADFEPFGKDEPLAGRSLTDLKTGGALLLPGPLLRDLQPDWRIRLAVILDPQPRIRLTYAVV